MPANKNAVERYMILDRCFSNFREEYTFDDLLRILDNEMSEDKDECISPRQLRSDIKYMRGKPFEAPIEVYPKYDGTRKWYYRYKDEKYRINQQKLTAKEADNLRVAMSTLKRFRGLSEYAWVEELITSMDKHFGLSIETEAVVGFEQNQELTGLEYLGRLIDAATAHQVLKIDYRNYKFGGRDLTFIFHPYFLKQYNNRWFAFGLGINQEDNKEYIANLALDRIQRIEPMPDTKFRVNKDIDFDHYFDNIVGVSVPAPGTPIETIVFRTSEKQFHYIESKPIHHSQTLVNRRELKFQIKVSPTIELIQRILSFGPDVEILSPESFRNLIKEKVEENYQLYFGVNKDCTEKQ